jgi:CheY-like chemotaxis protein
MPTRVTRVTRVLVIDDDDATRVAMRALLEDAGYPVLEATDADTALDVLRTSQEGLVVVFDYTACRAWTATRSWRWPCARGGWASATRSSV